MRITDKDGRGWWLVPTDPMSGAAEKFEPSGDAVMRTAWAACDGARAADPSLPACVCRTTAQPMQPDCEGAARAILLSIGSQ